MISLTKSVVYAFGGVFRGCTALVKVYIENEDRFYLNENAFLDCPSLKYIKCNAPYFYTSDYSVGYVTDENGTRVRGKNTVLIEGYLNYNSDRMIKAGVVTYKPIGIEYHVDAETDTVCIDYINSPEFYSESGVYLPAEIEGKPVQRLGSGKPVMAADCLYSYVYIPSTLKYIGDYAFMHCAAFSNLNIYDENNLESIGLQAFYGTNAQNNAEANHSTLTFGKIFYRCFSAEETYKVSDYYTTIAADAFAHNSSIKTVEIPENILVIGDGAFYDCTSLEQVTVSDTVTALGSGAFVNCVQLKDVTLGSGLEEIGSDLFVGCDALKTVTAPEGSKAADWCSQNGFGK